MPAATTSPIATATADAVARARELVSENANAARTLFSSTPPSAAPPPPAELEALRIRRAVAASHGPFAVRKRTRPSVPRPFAEHRLVEADSSTQVQRRAAGAATEGSSAALSAAMPSALRVHRERAARIAAERPTWHPPWRVYRVMAGHLGWVRSIGFDPLNEWFATGSADRTIKVWDLATGRLRLTLTGHIAAVRALIVSPRHPYMFSAAEDKTVKCWDLEHNRVVRHYHGHLSGVYAAALHPTLDVLLTAGRDSTVRVWDIRSRTQAMVLGGHRDTVNAVLARSVNPQVVSASADATVKLWDLTAGRCSATLTHHKRGVRALAAHPRAQSFVSAGADNVKSWGLPSGQFARNFGDAHAGGLINALAVKDDGVLVSGGDSGRVRFWDYDTASRFGEVTQTPQPGSLDCEAGVFALAFDRSGSRLISAEADKTVRMWKEDESANETTHPVQ